MSDIAAEDFVLINNLYSRYNLCSDMGDSDGYAECFTKNGVLEVQPHGVRIEGRTALRDYKVRDVGGRDGYHRHLNGLLNLVRLDETVVRGRCYLVAFAGDNGEFPSIADCGVYDDELVKEDGAWRFQKRLLVLDAATWKRP